MGNTGYYETHSIGEALRSIATLLPASWRVDDGTGDQPDPQADATVGFVSPSGDRASFVVEAKRSGAVPTAYLVSSLRELDERSSLPVLFVSDYIGPSLRAALADEGINFADSTGWVRVASEDPLVVLSGQGASRSPRPARAGAVTRLNGIATNRTIRVLATADPPCGVRDLADLAGVSPGSVSKLLVTLAAESIVDRDGRGRVITVRRRALIHRWARDYSFTTANKAVGYYIAPRGLERTLNHLDKVEEVAALTGSAAARRLLPTGTTSVVPLRLLALYATGPVELANELGLIEADPTTANVVIAAPQDPKILTPTRGELTLAPPALVLADLLTLPNRTDAEAEQLMDALARDDTAWRN